jgi:hypothetical protein
MEITSDSLYAAAMGLPEDERFALASRLLESLPEQPTGLNIDDPGLLDELQRRSADLEGSVPWNHLRREL